MRRLLYVLISIFIIASLVFVGFLWKTYEEDRQHFIQTNVGHAEALFSTSLKQQRRQISTVYETQLLRDDITQLLLHVKEAKIQREHLFFRSELYEKLLPIYHVLHSFGLKELRIFQSNNTYFLNLSASEVNINEDVSITAQHVSKIRQPIEGAVEEDDGVNWHYVYPIFHEKEYVGSVIFVFDVNAVIMPLEYLYDTSVSLEKATNESNNRQAVFMPYENAHKLMFRIALFDPTDQQTVANIVVTQTSAIFVKERQQFIASTLLFGIASVLLLGLMLWMHSLSKANQELSKDAISHHQEVGRLQRVLINYESFLSLMSYWRKPLDGVVMALNKKAKEQKDIPELIQSAKSLRMLSRVIDGFSFSYHREEQPLRIIPLFEAVWQVKQLYEESLKDEGIELVIENGTKTLVSIHLVMMVHAMINIVLFFKEHMTTQKKIPGTITLRIFDEGNKVCLVIESEAISFSKKTTPSHFSTGLDLSRLIIEREHGGMMESVHEENHGYFKIALPCVQEVHPKA